MNLRDSDAFVFRLVRQHRPGNHVADGVDARNIGREMMIGDNAAAIVERDAGFLEAETFRVRHAADRDQRNIGFDRFRCAASGRLDLAPSAARPTCRSP